MTDIPEDVMMAAKAAAYAVAGTTDDGWITSANGVRVVARAILAERERYAKAAEGFLLTPLSQGEEAALAAIPEDVAKEAKQAAWLGCLNRGVVVEWYSYALAILAEREKQAAYIHMLETMCSRGTPSGDEVAALDAALARLPA